MAPLGAQIARSEANDPVGICHPVAVLGVVVVDVVFRSGVERRWGNTLKSRESVPQHTRRTSPHGHDLVGVPQPNAVFVTMKALSSLRGYPQWAGPPGRP